MQETMTARSATTLPPRLYEALKEEIALSREILALMEQEKESLIRMDMQALIDLSNKKEYQVSRLQGLDAQIQEISRAVTGTTHNSPVRLGDLKSRLSQEEAQALEEHRLHLAKLREEIITRTVVHRNFVEESRSFFNDAIATVMSSVAERPLYGRGKAFNKPSLGLPSFVSREV